MSQTVTQYGRISPPRPEWLAKAPPEAIIEPDLPIIDTHHHLWHRRGVPGARRFVAGAGDALSAARVPRRLRHRPQHRRQRVPAVPLDVSRQRPARDAAGGRDRIRRRHRRDERQRRLRQDAGGGRHRRLRGPDQGRLGRAGAGGAYPCRRRAVPRRAALGRLGRRSDHRQQRARHGSRGCIARPEFRAGLAKLSALGLSLDAWVFHPQIADVTDSGAGVSRHQHHHGTLRRAARLRPVCRQARRGVRRVEGVGDRAGEMSERHDEAGRHDDAAGGVRLHGAAAPPSSEELAALWRPYIETCIELFGPQRCMFESNFPVEKMGIGWAALWNAFKRLASGASAEEKQALFAGTARRVYRLD